MQAARDAPLKVTQPCQRFSDIAGNTLSFPCRQQDQSVSGSRCIDPVSWCMMRCGLDSIKGGPAVLMVQCGSRKADTRLVTQLFIYSIHGLDEGW